MKKRKLLVIDSEPFDREIMAKVYSAEYFTLFAAYPNDCLDACVRFNPGVVVYEMRKPNIEALRLFCNAIIKFNPTLPFIVIVSHNTIELERFARLQGAFYYLIRPFNFQELWDALDAAFIHSMKKTDHFTSFQGGFFNNIDINKKERN